MVEKLELCRRLLLKDFDLNNVDKVLNVYTEQLIEGLCFDNKVIYGLSINENYDDKVLRYYRKRFSDYYKVHKQTFTTSTYLDLYRTDLKDTTVFNFIKYHYGSLRVEFNKTAPFIGRKLLDYLKEVEECFYSKEYLLSRYTYNLVELSEIIEYTEFVLDSTTLVNGLKFKYLSLNVREQKGMILVMHDLINHYDLLDAVKSNLTMKVYFTTVENKMNSIKKRYPLLM